MMGNFRVHMVMIHPLVPEHARVARIFVMEVHMVSWRVMLVILGVHVLLWDAQMGSG